jgi:flagellin FlaB
LITRLAIFLTTSAGSMDIDLSYTYVSITDSVNQVILNFNSSCFSTSTSNGLFGTLNMTNVTSSNYGVIVVRDVDSSCTSTNPILNSDDLVVLIIDSYDCFSGIGTRKEVTGRVIPEVGLNGVISFTTPSAYVNNIIDL